MIVRKVTKRDSLEILSWRNDKISIYFSKKKKVTIESHSKWYEKNLKNKKIKFYLGFIIKKNKKNNVGIVRFNIKNNHALVSIKLNPSMRGKGLSYVLLAAAIKKFLKFKKIKLIAEIKRNNFASISCFLKNRFIFFKSRNYYNYYQRP